MTDAAQALRLAAEMFDELDSEAPTDDPASVYRTVAEVARRRLDGVGSASITTWDGRRFTTVAATDDTARRADQLQYDRRSGPCVAAVLNEHERLCHVTDVSRDERWPADARKDAADLGFAGVLSVRLTGGDTTAAALNLYVPKPDGLGADTVQMALLLARHVRLALVAAGNAQRAANLEASRVSSQQIGAAVGLLMAIKDIGHDEARDLLRTTSQRINRRVADLAAEVVATRTLPRLGNRGPRAQDRAQNRAQDDAKREDQPKRPEM